MPVVEIESCVANTGPAGRGVILGVSNLRGVNGGEQGVVLIKVDPDLEGGGEAAGGGMDRGPRAGVPEVAANS